MSAATMASASVQKENVGQLAGSEYHLVPAAESPKKPARKRPQWRPLEDLEPIGDPAASARSPRGGRGRGSFRGARRGGNQFGKRGGRGGYYAQGMLYAGYGMPYTPAEIEAQVADCLTRQLEYYFSTDNLIRDVFLRSKMNERGYIPLALLITFNQIRMLTDRIDLLVTAARASPYLKCKNGMVRVREGWGKWTFPPMVHAHEDESSEEEFEQYQPEAETTEEKDGAEQDAPAAEGTEAEVAASSEDAAEAVNIDSTVQAT